ncbi:MAG: PDZ domain-containing protein, partial [Pirellulaceae bacterium]|nr:PDZ domain-containing protein [Pirellulaceae bacterium]
MRCLLGLSLCAIAICGAAATVRADDDEKKQQTERKPEIEAVIVVDVNGDGVDGGAVSSHWLGVFATPVEGALKAQLNLDSGFVVREVVAKSPAEAAGLQQHDIIKSYAGAKLVGDDDLIDAIKKHGGKSADLV